MRTRNGEKEINNHSSTSSKKRKLNAKSENSPTERVFTTPPTAAATDEEKKKWQGFCEIESEPAFFNVMLREFGVKGVRVQEVFGLDHDLLQYLPKPVYGMIFLFRYRDDDAGIQEAICPEHVWFANQITGNACASVALLNIVLNIPDIELGDNLRGFKEFTRDFTPALRGDQIVNFEFVKNIHNSFARKIDMLNIDRGMRNDLIHSRKRKASANVNSNSHDELAAFHFQAFMPIGNEVWKLDGLDRQPEKIGPAGSTEDDWLVLIAPVISARMAQDEGGQVEFALMSLVKDPIINYRDKLCQNIQAISFVEQRLKELNHTRKELLYEGETLTGRSEEFRISAGALLEVRIPEFLQRKISEADEASLMDLMQEMITDQSQLRESISIENAARKQDEDKAANRRHDYGPVIRTWLSKLATKNKFKALLEESM